MYKMINRFVEFNTLEEDVVYTVLNIQWLYGSTGYFYVIRMVKPDRSVYYMNIREGSMEGNIYDRLEKIGTGVIQKKRFTITKQTININSGVNSPCIIVSGNNDIVDLSP